MFTKILVANRGEIAVRIMRTCRELGIRSVAVHSDPDAGSLHVRLADEAVLLPGSSPAETYLDIDKVVKAALDTGVQAVHPGYGFLAENAQFAAAVAATGLVFIGPPAAAIEVMGEKVAARGVAQRAGVPQVPGSAGVITTAEQVTAFGAGHGYPVAIKASYGGGGRGMRLVESADQAADALQAAQREAGAAFGRRDVYLERYLSDARHVEVQILADTHGTVLWLGDRDCSIQRRHQKIIEESPAPGLTVELRTAMGEASVRLAREVGYVGAGTVEFLVEAAAGKFYFLEMNTRIQVEHGVTEEVLGMDLIDEQMRIAAGEHQRLTDSGPQPRGHAIEVRINAEDVTDGAFRPSPGVITVLDVPARTGVRLDSGYLAGDEVLPFYDSLIAKLVVWAPTREHSIRRTVQALWESTIVGVPTTIPAALAVLNHPDFAAARISTQWLEHTADLPALLAAQRPTSTSYPDEADKDINQSTGAKREQRNDRQQVWVAGRQYWIPSQREASDVSSAGILTTADQPAARSRVGGSLGPRATARKQAGSGTVTSPMQGTVVTVTVTEGQHVATGDVLMVLEAMKMENPIRASISGTVTTLSAEVGQVVPAGSVLALIEPALD